MTLPKILVIDDKYAESNQVQEKKIFLEATHLLEINFSQSDEDIELLLGQNAYESVNNGSTKSKSKTDATNDIVELKINNSDKIGYAVLCSGQKKENGKVINDIDVALEAVKKGMGRWGRWDLVLLDLRFAADVNKNENDTFGLKIREKLSEEYSDLKIVMLTTEHQQNLKDNNINFLSKADLNKNEFFIEHFVPMLINYAGLDSTQFNRFLGLKDVIAHDKVTIECFRNAKTFAESKSTILLFGETGVGKEIFAQYIHRMSPRTKKPFVSVNVNALNKDNPESDLFGHMKGAFTTAYNDHKGYFEQAEGGTIFLDEIGDLDSNIQGKFLRVLQEKQLKRLGGENDIQVDVRVIAATNKDLKQLVREGRFREDLFYRLNILIMLLPPLRDRKDDIQPLAEFFLKKNMTSGIKITDDAYEYLKTLHFPGNVRLLQNTLEKATIGKPSNSTISKGEIEKAYNDSYVELSDPSEAASAMTPPATENNVDMSRTTDAQSDDPVIKAIDDIKKVLLGKSDDLTGVLRKIEEVVGAILNRAKKSNQFMPAKNLMELLLDTNIIQKGVPGSEKKSKKGKKEKKEKTSKQYKHSISVSNPSVETQKIFGHIQAFCSHETLDSALEDYFGSRRQKKDETTSNST